MPSDTSSSEAETARVRAEARFKNLQRLKADAPLAMQDYQDAQRAERDKTARLRALRLAREPTT